MQIRQVTRRDFIFFQAEDGIRDIGVTGVQTCALPISLWELLHKSLRKFGKQSSLWTMEMAAEVSFEEGLTTEREIGRASCRERVQISVVVVSLKKKPDIAVADVVLRHLHTLCHFLVLD